MLQAIRTRYFGPSNVKGARVQAKAEAGSVVLSWNHALNKDENHKAACEALRKKLKWDTGHHSAMVGGVFNGDYYWVFADGIKADITESSMEMRS